MLWSVGSPSRNQNSSWRWEPSSLGHLPLDGMPQYELLTCEPWTQTGRNHQYLASLENMQEETTNNLQALGTNRKKPPISCKPWKQTGRNHQHFASLQPKQEETSNILQAFNTNRKKPEFLSILQVLNTNKKKPSKFASLEHGQEETRTRNILQA